MASGVYINWPVRAILCGRAIGRGSCWLQFFNDCINSVLCLLFLALCFSGYANPVLFPSFVGLDSLRVNEHFVPAKTMLSPTTHSLPPSIEVVMAVSVEDASVDGLSVSAGNAARCAAKGLCLCFNIY